MKRKRSAKSPQESFVETNHIVLPSHANALGTVFGGVVMGWIDIAAAIAAQRHSECVCVTASVDALYFLSPISVGSSVCLKARVVYVGRTSLIVAVEVNRQIFKRAGCFERCVTAYLSMVALNTRGQPTPVPPLKLKTKEEIRLFQEAAERRDFLLSRLKKEEGLRV